MSFPSEPLPGAGRGGAEKAKEGWGRAEKGGAGQGREEGWGKAGQRGLPVLGLRLGSLTGAWWGAGSGHVLFKLTMLGSPPPF